MCVNGNGRDPRSLPLQRGHRLELVRELPLNAQPLTLAAGSPRTTPRYFFLVNLFISSSSSSSSVSPVMKSRNSA